jgi:CheY-like chemotaxis protein
LKRILELEGATVICAPSAPTARKLIRETGPDILVSDIGLPDEDGYQLIRSIRSAGTENSGIPAIALTAFAGTEDRMRAFEAGFTRFLTKPVDAEHLVRTILDVRAEEA